MKNGREDAVAELLKVFFIVVVLVPATLRSACRTRV
jgi:hypothetical protein